MYERKVVTRPLTREEAQKLVGHIAVNGRKLTVEEIMASTNLGSVTASRNIMTGQMQSRDPKRTPIFVVKA